jgi:hypothetical protein
MRRLAVVLLGWFAIALVFAASTAPNSPSANYEVEVLVFDMQLPEFEGSELWTQAPRSADAGAATVESLSPTAEFSSAVTAMRADGRYRVLVHKRWIQSAESKANGPPVQLATDDKELAGTLKFYLARFLHLELNVSYQPHGTGTVATAGAPIPDSLPSYVINEQRRVKSNELNYFDHPKFGVLVRVAPAPG